MNFENIETDGLGKGTALANSDYIPNLDADEGGRAMGGQVLVALLVAVVFANIMQVFPAKNDGAFHLGRLDKTGQNTATDRHVAGKGALFVDICPVDGFRGSGKSEANILIPTTTLIFGDHALVVEIDGLLLGKRAKVLDNTRYKRC